MSSSEQWLPDDMLANVLGRLPPSSLAAARCVRKHWCAIINGRRLLRAHLLPLRLHALYCINLGHIERLTYFFAPPAASRRIPGGPLEFLEGHYSLEVDDHCNGLLLLCGNFMVVNPATRQWAELPDSPEPSIAHMLGRGVTVTVQDQDQDQEDHHRFLSPRSYLVYDPMAGSPQDFEVFLIPLLAHDLRDRQSIAIDIEEQEWPPSTLRIHVFSSRRWRWEERSWIRQGEPAGTMADMLQSDSWDRKAVYFRGALYVHCQNDSVLRITLSNDDNNMYQMLASPATLSKLGAERATFYLEKSEKGVYFALLYWIKFDICPQFRVWLLKEEEEINDGNHIIHMKWLLKTNISLQPLLVKPPPPLHSRHSFADDEWRVISNYSDEELEAPLAAAAAAHDPDDNEFAADDEWDFDSVNDIANKDSNNATEADPYYPVDFLGFHPYKEIVFFSLSSRTISYNLNTSKVQRLGKDISLPVGTRTCFPYTPCWLTMGELFQHS